MRFSRGLMGYGTEANFASTRAERGLLSQLLLITAIVDHYPPPHAAALPQQPNVQLLPTGATATATAARAAEDPAAALSCAGAAAASNWAATTAALEALALPTDWKSNCQSYAVVLARRVSVAVVDRQRLLEIRSLLKVTAPPYIPAALRELFSTPPRQLHTCGTSVLRELFGEQAGSCVLVAAAAAAAPLPLAFRALARAATSVPPGLCVPEALLYAGDSMAPVQKVVEAVAGRRASAHKLELALTDGRAGGQLAASAAETLAWATAGGVGRLAAGRLREIVALGSRGQRMVSDPWETEWGAQLLRFPASDLAAKCPAMKRAAHTLGVVLRVAAGAGGAAVASSAGPSGAPAPATLQLPVQRSELARYASLLWDEEEVMERDIRTFTLYNVRARVALFSADMTTYTILDWPQPPPAVAGAGAAAGGANEGVSGAAGAVGAASGGSGADSGSGGDAGAAAGTVAAAVAVLRLYLGPRLLGLWDSLEKKAPGKAHGDKGEATTAAAAPATPARRMAAVVDVPGLVEGRPQLVAGDAVFVRLEAERGEEFAAELLTVERGQVLLHMPPPYWKRLQELAGSAGSAAKEVRAAPPATAPPLAPPLVHVCLTFDRTPYGRMHDALLRAVLRHELLLPPPPSASAAAFAAAPPCGALPALPDDLYPGAPTAASAAFAIASASASSERYPPMHGASLVSAGGIAAAPVGPPGGAAVTVSCDAGLAELAAKLRLLGGTALNPEQRLACAAMLAGAGAGAELPFVLFGPPGTGKTATLVECALQLLAAAGVRRTGAEEAADAVRACDTGALARSGGGSSGAVRPVRLLLAAPQNFSADLIASRLAAALGKKAGNGLLLRLNDPRRRVVEAKLDVLPYCLEDKAKGAFRLPTPAEVRAAEVVVVSCSAAGLLREGAHLQEAAAADQVAAAEFTHVLVDEAGQALLPEVLIPLTLRTQGGAAMLCGDPRQLGPVVRSASAARDGLATSLLEQLIDAAAAEGSLRRGRTIAERAEALLAARGAPATAIPSSPPPPPLRGVMLVRNYRSASALLELPSRLFYDQQLRVRIPPVTTLGQ
ncbi:hypothetical protein GPECTOR_704g854 [Gonium pectorale]|uniref:DNA2/NAM7 helicase helicase domain-containing protein n=1 Tax=Gonium pectorale TaxID=33097 RepID=A0A150FU75_GONPE|nr:hypothetical protein GPECTOR_704g854 [Gonium pectorale]|eukprot:KXZ41162.1 hypothetical protein GPECTOR_704g854 [Gonium pectorale]